MTGFVVDPFTNNGYVADVDVSLNGGLPVVPPGTPTTTKYAVTTNNVVSTLFAPFANWNEANSIAQDYNNGLDPDNNSWGIIPVQVAASLV